MKKAIAFIRVSTDSQDDGERQLIQICNFCNAKGYYLSEDETISEIISGTITERDGLSELLHLTPADCDLVIVSESSRLSRDKSMLRLPVIVEAVQSIGLELLILGSNENKIYPANEVLTPMEVMYLVFEAYKNREEIKTNKVRFRTGKEKKISKGGYIGHKMPYGYRVNQTETGYFEKVEEEAEIISTAFKMVAMENYSIRKLSFYLLNLYNKTMGAGHLARMLHSRVYIGEFEVMGQKISTPKIITTELFENVQAKLSTNYLYLNKGTANYHQLKGLAKCSCGASLYIQKTGEGHYYYTCMNKKGTVYSKKCTEAGKEVNFLNSIVWSVTQAYINLADFKAKTEEKKRMIKLESKGIQRQIAQVTPERDELKERIRNTGVAISRTSIESVIDTLTQLMTELSEQESKLNKRIETLNREYSKLNTRLNEMENTLLPSLIENSTPEERHNIFTKYIERITNYPENRVRGFVVVTFKNGAEAIIATKTRPKYEAYRLPQGDKFNHTNRTVIETLIPAQSEEAILNHEFEILPDYYREATYTQLFERYYMEEFLMDLTSPTIQADQSPA